MARRGVAWRGWYPFGMPPGDARHDRLHRIFFDVDDTLITWNNRLRPHVHDVFAQIRADGHEIHIWSGLGIRADVVERHDLGSYISGLYRKPVFGYRERLLQFAPYVPDFVVDDHAEIVDALGGYCIPIAVGPMTDDREMWHAYDAFARHIHTTPPAGLRVPGERAP